MNGLAETAEKTAEALAEAEEAAAETEITEDADTAAIRETVAGIFEKEEAEAAEPEKEAAAEEASEVIPAEQDGPSGEI